MHRTRVEYVAGRRTVNHVLARASREERIFTGDPRDADAYRRDGDTSNEGELVTLERLRGAARVNRTSSFSEAVSPGMTRATRPRPATAATSTLTRGEMTTH